MQNVLSIVGRPTTDPELRYTPSGGAVANVVVAVQRNFKNNNGEYEADFVKVVAWKESAEYLANYGRKGKLISATGSFRSGSYENNDGIKVYTFELHASNVNVLEWENDSQNDGNAKAGKSGGGSTSVNRSNNTGNTRNTSRTGNGGSRNRQSPPIVINDDDLPY